MNEEVENFKIIRVKLNRKEREDDIVIKEIPLTIFLNGEEFVTLLCTPRDLKYLAIGFLATLGFIKKREDIKDILLDEEKGIIKIIADDTLELKKKDFTKSFKPLEYSKVLSDIKVKHIDIFNLMERFQRSSLLFKETGGVHSCAICENRTILKFNEDIGRHNALDKVFGECFLEGIMTHDKLILTSGRISSEILLKVAKWSIPIIISCSAPTNLAIRLAEQLGITLIGFVREERMNIYTYPERIIVNGKG